MQWQRPSPRLWTARQLSLAAVLTPVTLADFLGLALAHQTGALAASAAALAGVGLAGWLLLRGRYRSWGWAERDDDLVVRRGLLFQQTTVVPYGRMQFIDVSAGPVDRIFGLATVQLHTAAAATDARIPGLVHEDADRLRDRLAAAGEARSTGL